MQNCCCCCCCCFTCWWRLQQLCWVRPVTSWVRLCPWKSLSRRDSTAWGYLRWQVVSLFSLRCLQDTIHEDKKNKHKMLLFGISKTLWKMPLVKIMKLKFLWKLSDSQLKGIHHLSITPGLQGVFLFHFLFIRYITWSICFVFHWWNNLWHYHYYIMS